MRATCLGHSKQHEAAIKSATIAIDLDDSIAKAYGERAFNFYSLRRYKKALADYDRFVALEPTSFTGHGERGDVLLELDRPREAMRAFTRALKIAPRWPTAHSQRGSAARQIGDLEEARLSFGRAIALNGEDRYSALQFAEVLFEIGRGHEALRMIRNLAGDLKSYWHLMLRGQLAMRLGKLDVAARELQKAAENGDPSVQVDAKLLLGCVHLAQGEHGKAADTFRHELPESLARYRPWLALMRWCAEARSQPSNAADRLRTATADTSEKTKTLVAICVEADPRQLSAPGVERAHAACAQYFFAGWRALVRGDQARATICCLHASTPAQKSMRGGIWLAF
ncbi:MAG: tetratricopeptide repeat protein [Planctomycetota bacterium]